jgi:hypothetical protein
MIVFGFCHGSSFSDPRLDFPRFGIDQARETVGPAIKPNLAVQLARLVRRLLCRNDGLAGAYCLENPDTREVGASWSENVTGSAKSKETVPLASPIPEGAPSLESILCTEGLQQRPSLPPDHAKENAALVALASVLAESRHTILEILAETILRVTGADSSGLSLLTSDGAIPDHEGRRFYWPAIKGMWKEHVGGGTERDFGPCGDLLDRDRAVVSRLERWARNPWQSWSEWPADSESP